MYRQRECQESNWQGSFQRDGRRREVVPQKSGQAAEPQASELRDGGLSLLTLSLAQPHQQSGKKYQLSREGKKGGQSPGFLKALL